MKTSRAARSIAAIACVLLSSACSVVPGGQAVSNFASNTLNRGRPSKEELREGLVRYASRFEATVVAAANTIADGTRDTTIQRRALRWKLGMTPAVNEAAFQSDPLSGYVVMLTLATSMREYLTTGAGREVFAEQQPLAVDASDDLVAAARALGEQFLAPKELDRVTREVESLVRDQPIRGEFVAETLQTLVSSSASNPTFDWLTSIPMSPFRALQGVDEGAQAIREFNATAMEMARTVETMPRMIRWNLQLLALDVTGQGNVAEAIASFESLARSAESLSRTADALPASLRSLLDEAERTSRSLGPLSQSLERSAVAVAEAGQAWGGLVAELSKPPADPSKPSRPFDIREWEAAAAQVSTAAAELKSLLESAGAIAESDALAGPLAQLTNRVERLEAGSRELVDRVAWRGVQLILLFFGLLLAYRFVSHALARRAPHP